jgi:hypothetical protein
MATMEGPLEFRDSIAGGLGRLALVAAIGAVAGTQRYAGERARGAVVRMRLPRAGD